MKFVKYILTTSMVTCQMTGKGRCTSHDYEGMAETLGLSAIDNAPAWCGMRYSMLNIARITAVNGLNTPSNCNQCLEITGDGSANQEPVYVLAVDQKGDPGLDIARSSYQKIFPDKNWLDPQICNWRIVDPSYCAGICVGTPEECNQGSRNLLPAYLLPKMTSAKNGINEGAPTLTSPKESGKDVDGNNSSLVSTSTFKSSETILPKTDVSSIATIRQFPKEIKQLKNTTMVSPSISITSLKHVSTTKSTIFNPTTSNPSTTTTSYQTPSPMTLRYFFDGSNIRVSSSTSTTIHYLLFFVFFLHV